MKSIFSCLLCVLLFATGCVSSKRASVAYVLAPEIPAKPDGTVPVRIAELALPEYLNRLELVRRKGRNQVVISQYGRWATNLRAQMQSLLNQMVFAKEKTSLRIHFQSFTADDKGFSAEGVAYWEDGKEQPFTVFQPGKCDTDDLLVHKADEALSQVAQQLSKN